MNLKTENQITPGISDSEFIRAQVPMTKEEVRAVSICKLHLTENSVVYDIGSGTGSVAVEMARLSKCIKIFAIETNPEAVSLINQNLKKFELENVQVVEGMAPAALEGLPAPTHAFLGGTKGALKEILLCLSQKNPACRVVVNAVTLESVSKIHQTLSEIPVENVECVQMGINRAEGAGKYHLLKAENPVYIFSFNFESGEKA
jgi:precorrin-6Y C5,15-methyltransferase (decarboxylating)